MSVLDSVRRLVGSAYIDCGEDEFGLSPSRAMSKVTASSSAQQQQPRQNVLCSIGKAVGSLADTIGDELFPAVLEATEAEVKKLAGVHIEVVVENVPAHWKEWMYTTGCNSLCNDSTWDFLEDSFCNKKKQHEENTWDFLERLKFNSSRRDLWFSRDIKRIVMTVDEKADRNLVPPSSTCYVLWNEGDSEFKVIWLSRARQLRSPNTWITGDPRRFWILRDEIVFGLQLYQLPGKCFYKSDWLDGFDDVDPDGFSPTSTKKFKRWFQFRHWVIMWYANALPGWNYQYTKKPPPSPDGEPFQLSNVLSLPSLPDIKMPTITLPSLPDISLPTISMPSVELPSVEMPSMEMPSVELGSLPSIPDKKQRPKGKWATHGIIELAGMNVKDKGKTLVLSDINIIDFWELSCGHIRSERKEHQKLELECSSEEQAESWKLSLMESGAKEGEHVEPSCFEQCCCCCCCV